MGPLWCTSGGACQVTSAELGPCTSTLTSLGGLLGPAGVDSTRLSTGGYGKVPHSLYSRPIEVLRYTVLPCPLPALVSADTVKWYIQGVLLQTSHCVTCGRDWEVYCTIVRNMHCTPEHVQGDTCCAKLLPSLPSDHCPHPTHLTHAHLTHVHLTHEHLMHTPHMHPSHAHLTHAYPSHVHLTHAHLTHAHLTHAPLTCTPHTCTPHTCTPHTCTGKSQCT